MKIRMYNVGLGECFRLTSEEGNLTVNFGSRNRKIEKQEISTVFHTILQNIKEEEERTFLATQFGQEQLSGFFYVHKETEERVWDTICLPDIFTDRRMNETIALLILQDLSKGGYLPGKSVTLCMLLEILLKTPYHIKLLSRGNIIEKQYQVLLPDKDELCRQSKKTAYDIGIEEAFYEQDRKIWQELLKISGRMRELFMRVCALNENNMITRNKEHIPKELEDDWKNFRTDFQKLRRNPLFLGMAERCQDRQEELKEFQNRVSLAFHTCKDGKKNVLFTGGVTPDQIKWLERNEDGVVKMHDKYWCVQIPQHGTDRAYYDFKIYKPQHFLISNGLCAGQETAKISGRYTGMFAVPNVKMHCTNSDWCEGNSGGMCSCWNCEITAPRLYSQIQ
nr:hypothetical protein [uncultured Sellimonas sp.]